MKHETHRIVLIRPRATAPLSTLRSLPVNTNDGLRLISSRFAAPSIAFPCMEI